MQYRRMAGFVWCLSIFAQSRHLCALLMQIWGGSFAILKDTDSRGYGFSVYLPQSG